MLVSRRRSIAAVACGLLMTLVARAAHAQASTASECVADLDVLAPYMLANDAGARDHVAQKGQATFDAALVAARAMAAAAADDDACLTALRSYLATFRTTHLSIRSTAASAGGSRPAPPLPSFRVLSAETALLTVPSFADQAGEAIARTLDEHARDLAQRPNLVIDVRGNGGGSDWTYQPLLALVAANTRRDVGAMLLATAANSAANRAVCALLAPDSKQCRDAARAESEAMDRAPSGTFIAMPGEPAVAIVEPDHVAANPRRIGVLVDRRCGSTCEEFLLAVRQSFKVKLFGQSSAGSLDYSNLRPFVLPSGKRLLMYATSRSLRLPQFAVDLAGIAPDQVWPAPADAAAREQEVRDVQHVLESGPRGRGVTRRSHAGARAR